jgi:ADP-ribose pyrophosphatase
MKKQKQIKIAQQDTVYKGFFQIDQIFLQHSLYAGGMSQPIRRELLLRPDAVAVLPYDPYLDQVVLIEQFRIGAHVQSMGSWILEIIAGMVEVGERPEVVARREAMEEAGCTLQQIIPIYQFLSAPGATNECVHLYCAQVDAAQVGGVHGVTEEGEDILVRVQGFEQALSSLDKGLINSAIPIIALQWLQTHRQQLRSTWS